MLPLLLLLERKGPAMNANQVVLLTEDETHWLAAHVAPESEASGTAQGIYDKLNAALDRDPDLETLIAKAIAETGSIEWGNLNSINKAKALSQARAVLHALQEGTEK